MASIIKRPGKKGVSYQFKVNNGSDAAGKAIVRTKTWAVPPGWSEKRAQKEANRLAALFEEECKQLYGRRGNMKFEDYAKAWFTDYAEPKGLKRSTLNSYHQYEPRVYYAIGFIKLNDLSPRDIQKFINNLQEPGMNHRSSYYYSTTLGEAVTRRGMMQKELAELSGVCRTTISKACRGGRVSKETAQNISHAMGIEMDKLFTHGISSESYTLSPKTVHNIHAFISSVLTYAVKMGDVKENVAQRVMLPSTPQKEKEIYSLKDIDRLLVELENESLDTRVFMHILIFGGLRKGEALGLEWQHIDFEKQQIHIEQNQQYNPRDGYYIDTPKTHSGNRRIPLPSFIFDEIQTLRRQRMRAQSMLKDRWYPSNFLFVGDTGKPLSNSTMYERCKRVCKRADIKFRALHTLRHDYLTVLMASGTDPVTASKIAGHANTSITMNIYTHTSEQQKREAADRAAALLLHDVPKTKESS